jgi:hypothetical protein
MKRCHGPLFAVSLLLLVSTARAGTDLVTYPSDYKTQHELYTTVDKSDPKRGHSVRSMYVNHEAYEAARAGQPLPSGTVIIMEVYKAKLDAQQAPLKDAAGRFIKDDLSGVFVMAKQTGWGADYPPELRNGEWEYARFLPDGSRHDKTDMTTCFQCHKPMSQQDFVFTLPQLKGEKP